MQPNQKTYIGTYKVCKLFKKSNRVEVIRRGLTREEAQTLVNSYPDSNTHMIIFNKQFYQDKYFINI